MGNMNKVLTNVSQALSDEEKTTARNNIDAMKKSPSDNTEYVLYNGGYRALSKDVFVCEENTTTLSQILGAINDGKQLVVVRGSSYTNVGPCPASVAYKSSTQVELVVLYENRRSTNFVITSSGWQSNNYYYFIRHDLAYGIASISSVKDATINLHNSFNAVIVTNVPGYNVSSEVSNHHFCRVIVSSTDDTDATNYKMYCTAQKVSGELHLLEIYVNKTTSAWSIASDKVLNEIPDLKEASSLTFEDARELAKKGVSIKKDFYVFTPVYQSSSFVEFVNSDALSYGRVDYLSYFDDEEEFRESSYKLSLYTDDVNSKIRGVDDSEIKLTYDGFNYVEDGFDGAANADGTITIKLERWNEWAFENIVDILGVDGLKRIRIVSNEYGDDIDDYVDEIEVTKVNFELFVPGYLYRVNIFGYSASVTEIERNDEFVEIGGRKYPVVTIGTQKWITENLDLTWDGLTVGGTGSVSDNNPHAWYYSNLGEVYGNDGRKCGLLYNVNALKYIVDNSSTLLPSGWSVASRNDYATLLNSGLANGSVYSLFKNRPWHATDSVGTNKTRFGAVQAGERTSGSAFNQIGVKTSFWTRTSSSSNPDARIFVQFNSGTRSDYSTDNVNNGFSIRLVKNSVSLGGNLDDGQVTEEPQP